MQKKEAVKEMEVKVDEAVQTEDAVAEEKDVTPAKKPSAKAAAPKDESKKKPGRPPKKADEKSAAQTVQAVLEYQGNAIEIAKVEEKIKAQFVAEGHRAGNIKSLNIYMKPEDGKAYYVINDGKFSGDVDLF